MLAIGKWAEWSVPHQGLDHYASMHGLPFPFSFASLTEISLGTLKTTSERWHHHQIEAAWVLEPSWGENHLRIRNTRLGFCVRNKCLSCWSLHTVWGLFVTGVRSPSPMWQLLVFLGKGAKSRILGFLIMDVKFYISQNRSGYTTYRLLIFSMCVCDEGGLYSTLTLRYSGWWPFYSL